MALRTTLFKLLPWIGGLNTSVDESQIAPNELTVADNLLFAERGSRQIREGIDMDWDSASNGTESIVGQHDFRFGTTSKTQRLVGVTDGKKIYSYSSGTRSSDLFAGTVWSSTVTTCNMLTANNLCLIAVDGSGNVPKKWNGTGSVADLGTYVTTGDVADTSPTISNLASTLGVVLGATVTGTGIPANSTIIAISGTSITISNNATATNVGTAVTLSIAPPKASVFCEHQGRVWATDKENLDKLHYSPPGRPEIWGGLDDSGALDVGTGDGDPDGIVGMVSFKGVLFVGKRTKLYRIENNTPETYRPVLISSGIGFASPNAIALIDNDDVFFVSDRGIHSLAATDQYGDFEAAYLSKDIQRSFKEKFPKNRLKYAWGRYLSNINCYALAVTDNSFGTNANNAVWAYNITLKSWFRLYTDVSCQSMIVVNDSDRSRFYLGSNVQRIFQTFIGEKFDSDTSGAPTPIPMRISTGQLYMDDSAYTMKRFSKFVLFYRPTGNFTITVLIQIDNYEPQALAFSNLSSGDVLDVDFILDESVLDESPVAAPYALPISGYGRGVKVTIEQSGILQESDVEIQGFGFEWESAETRQQVVNAS